MADRPSFPPAGFLTLGLVSLAAGTVFVARAAIVEATTERIVSAALFAGLGLLLLLAATSQTRHP